MTPDPKNVNPNDQSSKAAANQRAEIDEILKRMDALPILDTRPENEILCY
jgi:hypothetical protein